MRIFSDVAQSRNRVLVAGWLWIGVVEFFIIQIIAQLAAVDYAMWGRDISSLGVSSCGEYVGPGGPPTVCSPRYAVLNQGLMILGFIQVFGLVLSWPAWPRNKTTTIGLLALGTASVGTFGVGLWPVDISLIPHQIAAGTHFVAMTLAMTLLAVGLWKHDRNYALFCAAAAATIVVGLVGYRSGFNLGLGRGTVQRIAAYPGAIWFIVTGFFMVARTRLARRHQPGASPL